mmetsp:Transcript_144696/g.252220  ORF Transcript_144696/g.252220 Transcript_144696/m.252220 type:complete len:211 (+) Transcript_144696:358-990(+)
MVDRRRADRPGLGADFHCHSGGQQLEGPCPRSQGRQDHPCCPLRCNLRPLGVHPLPPWCGHDRCLLRLVAPMGRPDCRGLCPEPPYREGHVEGLRQGPGLQLRQDRRSPGALQHHVFPWMALVLNFRWLWVLSTALRPEQGLLHSRIRKIPENSGNSKMGQFQKTPEKSGKIRKPTNDKNGPMLEKSGKIRIWGRLNRDKSSRFCKVCVL